MFDKLKKWTHNVFSETDNETICPVRLIAVFGTLQGLGMQAWDVFGNHAAFNLEQFGIGLGAILTTAGVALGLKKDSPRKDQ